MTQASSAFAASRDVFFDITFHVYAAHREPRHAGRFASIFARSARRHAELRELPDTFVFAADIAPSYSSPSSELIGPPTLDIATADGFNISCSGFSATATGFSQSSGHMWLHEAQLADNISVRLAIASQVS